jgi:hypothetical protein
MHRRKKHTRRRHHRARVGALNPKQPVVQLAAVALGYFLADTINTSIDKVIPASISTATDFKKYIPGAVETGLGAYLLLSKGRASLIKTGIGGIVAGAGLKRLLVQAGVVTGYQAVPVIGTHHRRRMAGYQSVPVVGGIPGQLQGVPVQLQGYRVNGPGYMPNGSGVPGMNGINGIGNIDGRGGSGITYGGSSGYMG